MGNILKEKIFGGKSVAATLSNIILFVHPKENIWQIFAYYIRKCQSLKIFGGKSVAATLPHILLSPQQTRGRRPPARHHQKHPSFSSNYQPSTELCFTTKTNVSSFFRSIALRAIPYHPCSSSPPSTVAPNPATALLGSFNNRESALGDACVCVQICARDTCVHFFLQIFASCICISRTCASPQSFYRCVCICMLPATLLNVMGHSPLQLWGSSAQIVPSTSESSA